MAQAGAETPITVSGRPRAAYEAAIERIVEHTPDTRSFFLRLPDGQRLAFKPGQFISLLLPVAGEILTRPYSIASSPEDGDLLEICLDLVPGGPGSHYLFARDVGETLSFTGPWGTFVLDQPPQAECVFIANGTGIAPIRPMIRRALASGPRPPLRLLYGAPREWALLYRAEWEDWAQSRPWFVFDPLLSDPPGGWSGLHGSLMEQVERRYVSQDSDRSRHFYICGVGGQVTQLRDLLRRAGYQRRAVQ
ncbi:MAG: FAD-dependent oxidoreductase [Deltaproteobacteria bacterium]|nr:FAD-dependent oxidoreductase [Deltaproteobacteria bacterium]